MAQKKQDRKIEDRVTLVEPKTVYLDDSGKQITESQYYKTIGSRQPSGGEEQISGTKPAAPTQTRAVYFAPKTVETLAEISAINKAKASEKESKKVEEVSAKEAELNERGSKGFDTLEDLARFNEDKKALEKEKTSIPFASVAPPQTTIDPVPEIPTSSTRNIPLPTFNQQVENFNKQAEIVQNQKKEFDSTVAEFEKEYQTIEKKYNSLNNKFENDWKLFLAEASDRAVEPEDTYIWNKYQNLKAQEKELNQVVNQLNLQGKYLNDFTTSNLNELIPKINSINKSGAYLLAQSKRYPSKPEATEKIDTLLESEFITEKKANVLKPKLSAAKVELTDTLLKSEKNVEARALSRPLNKVQIVDKTLENPIGSYAPKTSLEALELEKRLLQTSDKLARPYNAKSFEKWNDLQKQSEWNFAKEALINMGKSPEQIKLIEGQAGKNYDAVLYSVDGKGDFMLPSSKGWSQIELIPKEQIRAEIDKIKDGLKPPSALDKFRASVAGSIATKTQKDKYFNSLSEKKQKALSATIYADTELQAEQIERNKKAVEFFNDLGKTAKELWDKASKDKPDNTIIDYGKKISSTVDKALSKGVPIFLYGGEQKIASVPTIGNKDNVILNILSQIPKGAKKINENISPYLQGNKTAEFENYYQKYNQLSLDLSAYIKANKQLEKQYQDVKKQTAENKTYSKNISQAFKTYIEKRDNLEAKALTAESQLYNSLSSSPLDLIPQSAKQALNKIGETSLDFSGGTKFDVGSVVSQVTVPYNKMQDFWSGKSKELKTYIASGAIATGKKLDDTFFSDGYFIKPSKGNEFKMFDGIGGTVTKGINFVAGNQLKNRKPYLLEKTATGINTGWGYVAFIGAQSERHGYKVVFDENNTPKMTEGYYSIAAKPKNLINIPIGNSNVGLNALDALFLLAPQAPLKQGAKLSFKELVKSAFSNKSTKNLVNGVLPNISKNEYKDFLTVLSKLPVAERKQAMELRALADKTGKTTELGAYYLNKASGQVLNDVDLKTPSKVGGWVRNGIEYNPKTTELRITKATEWSEAELAAIGNYSLKNIRKMQISSYLKWLDDAKNKGDISAKDYVASQNHIQYLLKGLFDSLKDINKDPAKFKDISDGLVKEYFKKIIARAESYKLGKTKKGKFEWNSQELDELWKNYLTKNLKRFEGTTPDIKKLSKETKTPFSTLLDDLDNTGKQAPKFDVNKIWSEFDDYYKEANYFDKYYNTPKPPSITPPPSAAGVGSKKASKPSPSSTRAEESITSKEASQKAKPATQTAEKFTGDPPKTNVAVDLPTKNFDDIFSPKSLQAGFDIKKSAALIKEKPQGFADWFLSTNYRRGYSQSVDNKMLAKLSKDMNSNPIVTPLVATKALNEYKDINRELVTKFRIENNVTRDLDKKFIDAVSTGVDSPTKVGVGSTIDFSSIGKNVDRPTGGKSSNVVANINLTQTPVGVPTQTKSTTTTAVPTKTATTTKINIPTTVDKQITIRDGVVTETPTKTQTPTKTKTQTTTTTKPTKKLDDITGKLTKPTKTKRFFIPVIPPIPNGKFDSEAQKLVDEKVNPKLVSWRQGKVYPKVDLEKQTVKFSKAKPDKLKDGKTPRESFTVLKAKKYKPKNKKLSLGKVDAIIKPNGIAFTLKRKDVLSLPNFLKRNKYLKKLR